jgi:hypothetical protein
LVQTSPRRERRDNTAAIMSTLKNKVNTTIRMDTNPPQKSISGQKITAFTYILWLLKNDWEDISKSGRPSPPLPFN